MVLSVVNLQEAYAKALLVDRNRCAPPSTPATSSAGTRCCSTPTTPTSGRCARRPARSWGPRRTRSRRCARRATPSAWRPSATPSPSRPEHLTMRTATQIVDPVEDLWPDARPATRTHWHSSSSPPTCSARTAPSRTSAAATRRPKASRRRPHGARGRRHVGQGLGQRPGHDGPAAFHRPQARRGAAVVRARRDERRGDGCVSVALHARSGDAARLDRDAAACLRPGAARAPHASGRDQRAGRHGGR